MLPPVENNNPTEGDTIRDISPRLQRYVRIQIAIAIVALIITIAAAISIYPLARTRKRLRDEVAQLKAERDRLKQDQENLGQALLGTLTGKRKKAVKIALDLEKKVQFVMGGRKPETGFDMSGFIDHVLSQPEIEIIDPRLVPYCNQQCLMDKTGFVPSSTLAPDLRPGDLIFFTYNITMMYLGNQKCIGMLYQGTIETKDAHRDFEKIVGYSKPAYGD